MHDIRLQRRNRRLTHDFSLLPAKRILAFTLGNGQRNVQHVDALPRQQTGEGLADVIDAFGKAPLTRRWTSWPRALRATDKANDNEYRPMPRRRLSPWAPCRSRRIRIICSPCDCQRRYPWERPSAHGQLLQGLHFGEALERTNPANQTCMLQGPRHLGNDPVVDRHRYQLGMQSRHPLQQRVQRTRDCRALGNTTHGREHHPARKHRGLREQILQPAQWSRDPPGRAGQKRVHDLVQACDFSVATSDLNGEHLILCHCPLELFAVLSCSFDNQALLAMESGFRRTFRLQLSFQHFDLPGRFGQLHMLPGLDFCSGRPLLRCCFGSGRLLLLCCFGSGRRCCSAASAADALCCAMASAATALAAAQNADCGARTKSSNTFGPHVSAVASSGCASLT